MKEEELIKRLESIDLPRLEVQSHRRRLRRALLQSRYFKEQTKIGVFGSVKSKMKGVVEMLKSPRPVWQTALASMAATALIVGLCITIPALLRQSPMALAEATAMEDPGVQVLLAEKGVDPSEVHTVAVGSDEGNIYYVYLMKPSEDTVIGTVTVDIKEPEVTKIRLIEMSKPIGLKCSIAVEKTRWTKGDPALVSVTLENTSATEVTLKAIPAFTLNGTQYWGLVDITGENHALSANARSTISLGNGALIDSTIDIAKLGWDRSVSSTWPAQNLYALVPPGQYKLRLDIEVVDGGETEWIRSNVVIITISE